MAVACGTVPAILWRRQLRLAKEDAFPRTKRVSEPVRWILVTALATVMIAAVASLQGNRLIANAADAIQRTIPTALWPTPAAPRTRVPWLYLPYTWAGEGYLRKAISTRAARRAFRKAALVESRITDHWFPT